MELNLESARVAREVEARIKSELGRLPATEQKSVLERVALDVMTTLSTTNGAVSRARTGSVVSPAAKAGRQTASNGTEKRLWETILIYCQTHAAPRYSTVDLAEAVLPEKVKESRNVAISMVYTAIKRRSVGDSDDPYFAVLGKGKIRLATDEEREKAREKRGAS